MCQTCINVRSFQAAHVYALDELHKSLCDDKNSSASSSLKKMYENSAAVLLDEMIVAASPARLIHKAPYIQPWEKNKV